LEQGGDDGSGFVSEGGLVCGPDRLPSTMQRHLDGDV
jgi:hypothetical protein